jgi:hypothetical protein
MTKKQPDDPRRNAKLAPARIQRPKGKREESMIENFLHYPYSCGKLDGN